jgi:dethiobiotin synthetase
VKRIIFITGTDTGVGKTVLTALLLLHLRQMNVRGVALKPFCCGGREDVELLQSLQPGVLPDEVVNPYFFPKPLAPFAAGAGTVKDLSLKGILQKINRSKEFADILLIEGAGGVLVPITQTLSIADVIGDLKCEVFLVARNQLGTLNHIALSIEALKKRGVSRIKIILIDPTKKDLSSDSNAQVLESLFPKIGIFCLPFFSKNPNKTGHLVAIEKTFKKTLARLIEDN